MKIITLTQGHVSIVDDEDYELLSRFKWCASFGSRNRKWYARRWIKKYEREDLGERQQITMHRFLLRPSSHLVVDHINGNSLDNRKSNLEIITQEENMRRVQGWKKKGIKIVGSLDEIDF
jgi:hypothetical protein